MAAEITRARMEEEVLQGLNQLGEGIVYATVMGLPAPTAPPIPGIPAMHELPHRVNGLHPRIAANQAMQEVRYTQATELFPQMVPPHIEKEITASVILCRIKRAIKQWIHRVEMERRRRHTSVGMLSVMSSVSMLSVMSSVSDHCVSVLSTS
jgi:hypothetical protein